MSHPSCIFAVMLMTCMHCQLLTLLVITCTMMLWKHFFELVTFGSHMVLLHAATDKGPPYTVR